MFSQFPAILRLAALWKACAADPAPSSSSVRLNEIQVIGTHNSYHREPNIKAKPFFGLLIDSPEDYYYSHASLTDQLSHQSVRSLELDIYADYDSPGQFSDPLIYRMAGLNHSKEWHEQMTQRGAKIMHVADADVDAVCPSLKVCLTQLRDWSKKNPNHVPILIDVEFKTTDSYMVSIGGVPGEAWNETNLPFVDEEIRSVLGPDMLITPDDIRLQGGSNSGLTLEQAVLKYGWPSLDESRGKFLFVMDNNPTPKPALRDAYRANGHSNLEGRVIFTNSLEGQSDAAFIKRNDPTGANLGQIQDLVQKGYLIRTRADEPIDSVLISTAQSYAVLDRALKTGAQVVSTDWPGYGMAARYNSDYVAKLPSGAVVRCNPVNGDECSDVGGRGMDSETALVEGLAR